MTHVLLPTDFSEGSLTAAAFALDAFGTTHAKYLLLHAYDPPISTDPMFPQLQIQIARSFEDDLKAFEHRVRDLRPDTEIAITRTASFLPTIAAVEEMYHAQRVDVIVMGALGKNKSPVWGSTTSVMVKNSQRPVIVVPGTWEPKAITKILFADDRLGVGGKHTVAVLVKLAKRYGSEIVMTHVRATAADTPTPPGYSLRESWFDGVRHANADAIGGDVADKIQELLETGEFGMVAVLHRDRGTIGHLFHRSLAKQMALHATVPLLVLEDR